MKATASFNKFYFSRALFFQKSLLLFCTALCIGLLLGCSARKTAYRFADTYLHHELDSSFDLDSAQSKFIKTQLAFHLEWHRTSELPKVTALLNSLATRVQQPGFTSGDADTFLKNLLGLRNNIAAQVRNDTGAFLHSVSANQLKYVEKENAKRNTKRLKTLKLPAAEYLEKKHEGVAKIAKYWVGGISPKQNEMLAEFVQAGRGYENLKFEHALQSQKNFVNFLKGGPSSVDISQQLELWVTQPESQFSDVYKKSADANRVRLINLLVDFDSSLQPEQRATLVKELALLREDIQFLIDQKTKKRMPQKTK